MTNCYYPNIEEPANKFILTLPMESILSENVLQKLKSMFGDNIVYFDYDSLLVVAACATEGYRSNYRMQLVLEKHPSDITLILKVLCQKLYLIPSGIGKVLCTILTSHIGCQDANNWISTNPILPPRLLLSFQAILAFQQMWQTLNLMWYINRF